MGIALALVVAFAQWKGWLPEDHPSGSGKKPQTIPAPPTGNLPPSGEWQELAGCTLVEDRDNDGDSFQVLYQGARYTLRLYFADCAEKRVTQLTRERVAEQGKYFGGLSEEATVKAGERGRDFTLPRLRAAPFMVMTRWEKVFGGPRIYGFVTVADGDLAELLVREGLARIHTKGVDRPGGGTSRAEKEKLTALETAARKARRGAWGMR
ncbi:MAG: hypothetical protein JWM59_2071 [Verrucomicrobiales bacterium]|nr:hypothetical protein [Verrucomicrobiales bacterium]